MSIDCERIVVAAPSVRIEARTPDEGVVLQARHVEHEASDFHLAGATRETLRVLVSDQPSYPWVGYVSEDLGEREGSEPAMVDAVRELKKMVTWFKPGVIRGSAPTLPVKILEVLVARERVLPALHDYALNTGLIVVEGKYAYLHPQQFGINIIDIRNRSATPAIRDYLTDFVRSNS